MLFVAFYIQVDSFPPGVEVRAMLESQFLYKYICSKRHDIMSSKYNRKNLSFFFLMDYSIHDDTISK